MRLEDGARRARTADLLRATQALFQLSYGPLLLFQFSREVEVIRPIDAPPLVVPT